MIGSSTMETLPVEEMIQVRPGPKLLVEWTPRWENFVTSLRPALARSEARLAGEAPFGLLPRWFVFSTYALEAFLLFVAIVVPGKLAQMRPYVAPRLSTHDVIYYSGDELPRTEDLAGAEAGRTGRSGGHEARHHTQTIKIARGSSLTPRVVDAPNLKLPATRDAVANLLAIQPNPGPPPVEGMRSARNVPNLAANVVAPAPDVTRDFTRNGITVTAVVPPAPNFSRDQPLIAPRINAEVIPPAPNVSQRSTLVAPALAPAVIPPSPSVSREHTLTAPALDSSVIAPAPSTSRDRTRSAPALTASVIPPAPGGVSREISRTPVQMSNVSVVPPPVSAPERAGVRNPKISLPAPSVIAPPPSADVSRDMRRLASGSVPDPSRSVVPPPPTQSGSGSLLSSLVGKIFGASDVVPPPPSVNSSDSRGSTTLATNVVPPPPSVANSAAGGNPRGARSGAGSTLGTNVIAPPPSTGISGATGTRSLSAAAAPALGPPSVVPPPPAISGAGGGTGTTGGGSGAPKGTLLANNVVPPPPTLGGGANATGSGIGRNGAGLGAPLDAGSAAPPPTNGGSGNAGSAVISTQPGSKVGLPSTSGAGSLAMSPSGNDKPGLGGAGGGSGIAHGSDTGSGLKGADAGAGRTGSAHGSDPATRGGISMNPGSGGAGNAPAGSPPIRGVDISGGSSQVTLPSFGADTAAGDPATPKHSPAKPKEVLGVTIVATATSGGPFEPYKNLLHGQTYTTYINTSLGQVPMQFAEAVPNNQPGGLTAPESIRTTLPDGLPRARMVVSCTLDASGNLKNVVVREPGPAEMTAKVVAALRGWKFQPALRGEQPVEVNAILGFNIDTNDRF
jgi:TonB family protein